MDPDVIMMIGTAGHVDHGKTRLVRLLTGCNTDRLKEEQERGLTIELGFAPCLLKGEVAVGIVDVPGHEKFVRNMVAGVSGIDMTVLVVAADDGIMPQTIEHFQIMELVGVRHGMVAVTKTDLVSEERVLEVVEQVREFLTGTFMEGAKICPVSSETFDGFFEFYEVLVEEIQGLTKRKSDGVFRMPVLNAFTQQGFGAVVTGIPVDGTIGIGDQVELVPGQRKGKVRGLQRFLRDASEGGFGQCLALNVPELGKNPPSRGEVLCAPGFMESRESFHLRLSVVGGVGEPVRNAEHVVFHTGTSERRGKLYLLEEKVLGPGQVGLGTIVLSTPIAAAVHDKFIIRRPSPAMTVAGGEIIGLAETGRKPNRKRILGRLQAFVETFAGIGPTSPERREREIEYFLRSDGETGASLADIGRGTLLAREVVEDRLSRLAKEEKVLLLGPDLFIHRESYASCLEEAARRVEEASSDATSLSLNLADLRQGLDWPAALWSRIQEDLEASKLVARRDDKLVLETAVSNLDDADQDLMTRLHAVYEESGFRSPRPDELPERLGTSPVEVDRLLDLLCARGKLFRLSKNVVLSLSWVREAQTKVIEIIGEKGILDSGEFKHVIGSTRKYALAILDFLDARKVTVRRGNLRSLSANHEKNLL